MSLYQVHSPQHEPAPTAGDSDYPQQSADGSVWIAAEAGHQGIAEDLDGPATVFHLEIIPSFINNALVILSPSTWQ
jgi:hypothetical protein